MLGEVRDQEQAMQPARFVVGSAYCVHVAHTFRFHGNNAIRADKRYLGTTIAALWSQARMGEVVGSPEAIRLETPSSQSSSRH